MAYNLHMLLLMKELLQLNILLVKKLHQLIITIVSQLYLFKSRSCKLLGLTEQQAKEKGYDVKVGKFSFKAIGKALVYGESDGFVKIIADEETNDILRCSYDWTTCNRYDF